MTEFFGPLLGVMPARKTWIMPSTWSTRPATDLPRAWKASIPGSRSTGENGSRPATCTSIGAPPGRSYCASPSAAWENPPSGRGIKAGGPNYVSQFMEFEEKGYPVVGDLKHGHQLLYLAQQWQQELNWGRHPEMETDLKKTVRAIRSYLYHYERIFSLEHDYFHLRGQDNILRYRTIDRVLVRIHPDDTLFDILARIAAAKISGCRLVVTVPRGVQSKAMDFLYGVEGKKILQGTGLTIQSDDDLIKPFPKIDRIRYAAPDRVPQKVYEAAAKRGEHICASPVVMEGRIELLRYFREQSVCNTYHRYGNLGERGLTEDWG